MKSGMWRVFVLALALTAATAVSACGGPELRTRQTRVPGEYLVTLVAPDSVKVIVDLYGSFGIKGIEDLGHNRHLVTLGEDPGPARMEQLRAADDRVQSVQPNFVYGAR